MSRRREYRVSWQRVDSPRHSKRFPTRQRAVSYLSAVRAMSPEERYGDKVDEPMHLGCSAGRTYGDPPCHKCEGRTWREDWNLRFMSGGPLDIKPLLWSKLDSRPLPDWEDEPPEPAIEFKHGDVIRPKVGVQTRRLMVVTDHLAWDLNDAYPLQDTTVPYGKHNWVKVDED